MLAVVCATYASLGAAAQKPQDAPANSESDHVRVTLIAEHTSLAPGQSLQIGLLLQHEPHWHTYWINPGDSGLPTTLTWTLPPGFRTQDIAWPLPKRFDVGGLYNFGYDGEVLLPVTLEVPANAAPGTDRARRGRGEVARLPRRMHSGQGVADARSPDRRAAARARYALDRAVRARSSRRARSDRLESAARLDGDRIVITARGPGLPDADGLDAFVAQRKLADKQTTARAARRRRADCRLRQERLFRNFADHIRSGNHEAIRRRRARLARAGSVCRRAAGGALSIHPWRSS